MNKEQIKEKLLCAIHNNISKLEVSSIFAQSRLKIGEYLILIDPLIYLGCKKITKNIKAKYFWQQDKTIEVEGDSIFIKGLICNGVTYEITKEDYDSIFAEKQKQTEEKFLETLNKHCNG